MSIKHKNPPTSLCLLLLCPLEGALGLQPKAGDGSWQGQRWPGWRGQQTELLVARRAQHSPNDPKWVRKAQKHPLQIAERPDRLSEAETWYGASSGRFSAELGSGVGQPPQSLFAHQRGVLNPGLWGAWDASGYPRLQPPALLPHRHPRRLAMYVLALNLFIPNTTETPQNLSAGRLWLTPVIFSLASDTSF